MKLKLSIIQNMGADAAIFENLPLSQFLIGIPALFPHLLRPLFIGGIK